MAEYISERQLRLLMRENQKREEEIKEMERKRNEEKAMRKRIRSHKIESTDELGNSLIDKGEIDIDKELLWLENKFIDRSSNEINNSEDRIESEEDRSIDQFEKQIRKMKERERKLSEIVEEKKRQQNCQQLERNRMKLERLKRLKKEKLELEKRLAEHENTISNLDDISIHHESTIMDTPKPQNPYIKPIIPKLTENTYEEWKLEIESIVSTKIYNSEVLRQAVRNSITGSARKILLTINPMASTEEIINKLDNIYGNVRSGESVISEFYQSTQKKSESISDWGIRLEGLLQSAIEKGQIMIGQREELLRNRFWRYLWDEELRNSTRIYFETCDNFEELRRKVRQEEQELISRKDRVKSSKPESLPSINSQQVEQQAKLIKELTEQLNAMKLKMKELEKKSMEPNYNAGRGWRGRGRYNRRNWNFHGYSGHKNQQEDNQDLNSQ